MNVKFRIPIVWDLYASTDVRIRGYYSEPKVVREQIIWETLG